MSSQRVYTTPVELTQWTVPGHAEATFSWEYDANRDRLLRLYEKGKDQQWNATHRIDWDLTVDPSDTSLAPDEILPIYGSPVWDKLSRAQRDEVRHHYLSWSTSQFLHGEQGALICSAKIVQTVPDMDSKFYAATQTIDEARHVETYTRYLHEKLNLAYPINPSLKSLLNDTITDSRWDFTYLGMQVLIEGVALAAFSMIRDYMRDPLGRSINAYVMQDEARHVAFGRLALKDAYANLSDAERDEREEFIIEGAYLLRDRFLAHEIWETLGLPVTECVRWVDQAQIMTAFRKALFSRVVPCVKDIGLWGPMVRRAFTDMGVLEFADLDLDELSDSDDRIAEEMERLLAERKQRGRVADNGSRGAALAETVAAGEDATW